MPLGPSAEKRDLQGRAHGLARHDARTCPRGAPMSTTIVGGGTAQAVRTPAVPAVFVREKLPHRRQGDGDGGAVRPEDAG